MGKRSKKKQANEASAKERSSLAEKNRLERAIEEMEREARRAKEDARSKEERAAEAEQQIVKEEEKALRKPLPFRPSEMPTKQSESIQGLGAAPGAGIGVGTILLGLVAVGAVVYALDAQKTKNSGPPTLIETLE